jgi:hypothetical protein
MKFLHHAASALLLGCLLPSSSIVNALEGVLLGQLEMEMGSRSNTNPNEFLVQVITQTQDFLNDAFSAIYKDTDYQFSHTSLSVTTYSIDSTTDGGKKNNGGESYIASMDLAGTIFFGDAPPQEQVSTVISAAFQQQNQLFLQSLVQSTDPFLQDINYAIVRVVKNNEKTNQANATGASSDLDSWMLAIIVGAGTFIVVFFCCLVFVCFTPLSELQPDIENHGSSRSGKSIKPIDTKDTDNASDDGAEFWEGDDAERPTPTSLSPVRSITSQDSSRFTYNPKSGRSNDSDPERGFLTGPAEPDDIEAWEQEEGTINRSTNMPFGHDISAIEKHKDLSLIEEGDFEDVTPHKPEAGVISLQQQKIKGQYLSRQAVFETDHRRGGRGSGTGTSSQQRPTSSNRGANNSNSSNGASSSVSASRPPKVKNNNTSAVNDVIDDLNNLSAQFDKHRGGSSGNKLSEA